MSHRITTQASLLFAVCLSACLCFSLDEWISLFRNLIRAGQPVSQPWFWRCCVMSCLSNNEAVGLSSCSFYIWSVYSFVVRLVFGMAVAQGALLLGSDSITRLLFSDWIKQCTLSVSMIASWNEVHPLWFNIA